MTTVHVAPIGDAIDHHIPGGWLGHGVDCDCGECGPGKWVVLEAIDYADDPADTACPCGPAVEMVPNDNGPAGWLITHASLDGREQQEVIA